MNKGFISGDIFFNEQKYEFLNWIQWAVYEGKWNALLSQSKVTAGAESWGCRINGACPQVLEYEE